MTNACTTSVGRFGVTQVPRMLLLSEGANWLAYEDRAVDLAFLAK